METNNNGQPPKKEPWIKVGSVWQNTNRDTGEVMGSYIALNQSIILKDGEKDVKLHVEDPRKNKFKTPEQLAKLPANLLFDVKVNPTQAQRLAKPLVQVQFEKKGTPTGDAPF